MFTSIVDHPQGAVCRREVLARTKGGREVQVRGGRGRGWGGGGGNGGGGDGGVE